jgi:hypothetical protein
LKTINRRFDITPASGNNWDWRLRNEVITFEVISVISETSKGIHLKLKIKGGSLTVWLSKKLIRIYEYDSEGGHTKEVEIPQWLAKRTGLIKEEM